MSIYSLILLYQFRTSQLFYVWFCYFLTWVEVSQETSKMVWYSHLFKHFLQFVVIHTVKGFSVVNEAEGDVFLELPCFLYDWMNVGNWFLVPLTLKCSFYIWKFPTDVLLKPSSKDFVHNLASVWNECSCTIVWTFSGTGMKTDLSSPVATAEFSKFAGILSAAQHHLLGFEIAQL